MPPARARRRVAARSGVPDELPGHRPSAMRGHDVAFGNGRRGGRVVLGFPNAAFGATLPGAGRGANRLARTDGIAVHRQCTPIGLRSCKDIPIQRPGSILSVQSRIDRSNELRLNHAFWKGGKFCHSHQGSRRNVCTRANRYKDSPMQLECRKLMSGI